MSQKNKLKIAVGSLFSVALLAISQPVLADYPEKPVHYIVPFTPGGSTDFTGRTLGNGMSKIFGQPVVVENRAGAGGNVGAGYVARATPDGYTLLQGTIGTHGFNPTLFTSLPYDAQKDFVPIARMTAGTNVLVVNPKLPITNVVELIEYAKKNPGKLTMGSSGPGSSIHMSGELFQMMTDTKFTHVPYRGGSPAVNDLIAGHIDIMFDNLTSSLPQIRAGKLRPLGVTSVKRNNKLPDVPTLDEAGVKGYEMTSWSGVFAPAGTPPDVVEKINTTVNAALSDPDTLKVLNDGGIEISLMSVPEFQKFVDDEIKRWGELVKKANLRAQ